MYDVERSFRLLVYGAMVPFVNEIILRLGGGDSHDAR
jgi:hypothetical protein